MDLKQGGGSENPNFDSIVSNGPKDTVSSLRWSPVTNLLVAGTWSEEVRVWDIATTGQATPKLVWKHPAPVLTVDCNADQVVFSGCCDGSVRMMPLSANGQTATQQEIGKHAAPVKAVVWNKTVNAVISGSWDKTVRVFDPRAKSTPSANPGGFGQQQQQQGEGKAEVVRLKVSGAVHGLDNRDHLLVVATSDRCSVVYDLRNMRSPLKEYAPALDKQSTGVCLFPDRKSFALSSIEGRVRIQYLDEADSKKSFNFRCHKVGDYDAYAANGVSVSPAHDALATYGSDGTVVFWDKERRQKLSALLRMPEPITAGSFNKDGNIYAYATGYDWSQGLENAHKTSGPQIFLHSILPPEIAPRDS